jgi:predicted dehydrogenase
MPLNGCIEPTAGFVMKSPQQVIQAGRIGRAAQLVTSDCKVNMENKIKIPRREFIKAAAAIAAFPAILPASALGADDRPAPSNRINCAVIGLGDRGSHHIRGLRDIADAQILAVCDPYRSKGDKLRAEVDAHYAQAATGGFKGCTAYQDYREVLARADIDAVFIAAPENWHAIMSIDAMRAGKDVYCEKALSLTVAEGRAMCDAVRRTKRILQVGTQQRSDRWFRRACEWVLNGYLGNVHTVQVSVPGGRSLPVAAPSEPPPDLNYDLWLGPARWTPYNDQKCTFNWYFMQDYCAGWIQSWGVHHVDIALWGQPALIDSTLEVEGTATFPAEGQANTSLTWNVTCAPPRGPKLIFTDAATHSPAGITFIGDKGRVFVTRGSIKTEPEDLLEVTLKPTERQLQVSSHHQRDFFEAMRTRRDPVAPVEGGHAATTLTLVADIATRLKRKLTWDWKAEHFRNDDAANAMLSRPLRSPWKL